MPARWRPQPIKYRVLERQPITERLQSISLETPLRCQTEKNFAVTR